MASRERQNADYVVRLDWMLTDLDDLWQAYDDGQHEELIDAIGRSIRGAVDARELLQAERTDES